MNKILPSIAMMPTSAASQANRPTQAGGIAPAAAAAGSVLGRNATAAPDFSNLLGSMLSEVSAAQAKSSGMNQRLQMGDPKTTVEDTVLAMNTASVQFQMVVQVRNKLVQSYTDIMNMPV